MNTQILQLMENTHLNQPESQQLFNQVLQSQLSDIEITAMLTAFKLKGVTAEEIAGAAAALKKAAVSMPGVERIKCADSCGTGGDGLQTLNISTLTALTCAAAGLPMAKHGNRSVSSECGSADILEALGTPIEASPELALEGLIESNFCFLYAPQYHAGVSRVMPIRKQLKTRTVFNLLGPLINPASPKFQLMGIYDASLLKDMADALALIGIERAMVVNADGMDELSIAGKTNVAELQQGNVTEYTLTPADFGLKTHKLADIQISNRQDSLLRTKAFLQGEGQEAENHAVAMNSGALLYLSGIVTSLEKGADLALDLIAQQKPYQVLQSYIQVIKGES